MSSNAHWSHVLRLSTPVLALCFVVVFLALTPSVAAADRAAANGTNATASPQIDLSLNGHSVDGGWEVVQNNPKLAIDVAVGPYAGVDTTVQEVVVRRDGQTIRSSSPEKAQANVTMDLPLNRGNNTITVIATDSDESINSRTFRISKDTIPPWVGLTSPYESDLNGPIPDGNVSDADVTLSFLAADFNRIVSGEVWHTYNGTLETVSLEDPGTQFNQSFLLGPGTNDMRVSLTDVAGNTRTWDFNLTLEDTTGAKIGVTPNKYGDVPPPTAEPIPIKDSAPTSEITLSGTITDNVWVHNASILVKHVNANSKTGRTSYTRQIREWTPYEHQRSGRSITFSERLPLRLADRDKKNRTGINLIYVRAQDYSGQVINQTINVTRLPGPAPTTVRRNSPPAVRISERRTHLRDDGHVQVVATASDSDRDIDVIEIESETGAGSVTGYKRFTNLSSLQTLSFNTSLQASEKPVIVTVRVRDENGGRAIDKYRLDGDDADAIPPQSTPPRTSAPPQTTTAPPTVTTAPQPATTERPTAATNTTVAPDSSGGLLGGVLGGVLGFAGAIIPFVIGGIVFVTVSYFALQQVQGSEDAA
ncbi:hypothetical protein ACFR9U_07670 [Halorientalis brevis]|uniref:PGF-pre-PGF domain-containing protein n=1 Tax=Halorientalis brevis TaxID=1126241 RepID=A0ABD6CCC5_9EURY|nr:hypothetical protein [Halorientalis brevis]